MNAKMWTKERIAMVLVQLYIISMVIVTSANPRIKGVVCKSNQPVVVTEK